jgi:homoserine kinase type II
MTVWTPLSLEEINDWLVAHHFHRAKVMRPVEQGVEDSVYALLLENDVRVCLRLYERTEPTGALDLTSRLASKGLAACAPLTDGKGKVLGELKGKPAALFPWVEGRWRRAPALSQIAEIGLFLGRVAQNAEGLSKGWTCPNPRGKDWFHATAGKILPLLDEEEKAFLVQEIATQTAFWWAEKRPDGISYGPIHGDLFRNNVLFGKVGNLSGVLDWGFCAQDEPLIYDLAIAANDWCLAADGVALDALKVKTLLVARETIVPLTDQERSAWPMALRLAALRFYLSRMHDVLNPRTEDVGKSLDPRVFEAILWDRIKTPYILTQTFESAPLARQDH